MVTVPVFALMGVTDEPAELEGYVPIPAEAARRLAAAATYTTPPEAPPGDRGPSSTTRILQDLETAKPTGRIPDPGLLPPF